MNLDFERNETLRQSVRIKKKAPLPPVVPAEYKPQRNQVIKAQSFSSYTRTVMGNNVRDFVRPVVVSAVKKTNEESSDDEDQSKMALRDIQRQINEIEYFSHHPKDVIPVQNERKFPEVNKTRYDEMESLLNTGISDVAPEGGFQYLSNKPDDSTDDNEQQKFHRGINSRSTTSSVMITPSSSRQINQVAMNIKIKSQRPAARTASDTKQNENIRPTVARYRDILNQRTIIQPTIVNKNPPLQRTNINVTPTKVNIYEVVDINTQNTNPTNKSHHLINNKRTIARESTDQVTNNQLTNINFILF